MAARRLRRDWVSVLLWSCGVGTLTLAPTGCGEDLPAAMSSTGDSSGAAASDGSSTAAATGASADAGSTTGDDTGLTSGLDDTADSDGDTTGAPPSGTVHVRFAFIHGVLGSADAQMTAEDEAADMEAWLLEHAEAHASRYTAAHPNIEVEVESARLNLYTDDDGALLEPGLDAVGDGTGVGTAVRWRQQLVAKLQAAYPDGEGNLVLVGHSTGARVALEVAADVGVDGQPESTRWGMQDRIAGVVALHGMIEALNSPEYDFIGPTDFLTACKLVQADGWCEYAALVSGVPAADWVAANKRGLFLVSFASCGISGWSGPTDRSLPLRAQASPAAFGMSMSEIAGGSLAPAHGVLYGNFCHSDVTSAGSDAHEQAVQAAMQHVLDWVFVAAPRVVLSEEDGQRVEIAPLESATWSDQAVLGDACPPGEVDDMQPMVVGACLHDDGSDHVLDASNLVDVSSGGDCTAGVRWQHLHAGEIHGAQLWVKPASIPPEGGLVSQLPFG